LNGEGREPVGLHDLRSCAGLLFAAGTPSRRSQPFFATRTRASRPTSTRAWSSRNASTSGRSRGGFRWSLTAVAADRVYFTGELRRAMSSCAPQTRTSKRIVATRRASPSSGGLEVPSSNLGAPTEYPCGFAVHLRNLLMCRQSPQIPQTSLSSCARPLQPGRLEPVEDFGLPRTQPPAELEGGDRPFSAQSTIVPAAKPSNSASSAAVRRRSLTASLPLTMRNPNAGPTAYLLLKGRGEAEDASQPGRAGFVPPWTGPPFRTEHVCARLDDARGSSGRRC
jgi:hypothetical protein